MDKEDVQPDHEDSNPSIGCTVLIQEGYANPYDMEGEDEEIPVEIPETIVKVEPIDLDEYDESNSQVQTEIYEHEYQKYHYKTPHFRESNRITVQGVRDVENRFETEVFSRLDCNRNEKEAQLQGNEGVATSNATLWGSLSLGGVTDVAVRRILERTGRKRKYMREYMRKRRAKIKEASVGSFYEESSKRKVPNTRDASDERVIERILKKREYLREYQRRRRAKLRARELGIYSMEEEEEELERIRDFKGIISLRNSEIEKGTKLQEDLIKENSVPSLCEASVVTNVEDFGEAVDEHQENDRLTESESRSEGNETKTEPELKEVSPDPRCSMPEENAKDEGKASNDDVHQNRILRRRQYIREYQRRRRARIIAEKMELLSSYKTKNKETSQDGVELRSLDWTEDKKGLKLPEDDSEEVSNSSLFEISKARKGEDDVQKDVKSSSESKASRDEIEIVEIEEAPEVSEVEEIPAADTKAKRNTTGHQNKAGVYLLQIPVTLLLKLSPKGKHNTQKDPLALEDEADEKVPPPPILLSQPYSLQTPSLQPSTSSVPKDSFSSGGTVNQTGPVPIRLTRAYSTEINRGIETGGLKDTTSSVQVSALSSVGERIQLIDHTTVVGDRRMQQSGNIYGPGVSKKEIKIPQQVDDSSSPKMASNQKKRKVVGGSFADELQEEVICSNLDKKSYICDVCGFVASSIGSMYSHTRNHSEQEQFQRKISRKTLVQKYNLEKHKKLNNDERRFSCKQCDKSYVTQQDLLRHRKSHKDWEFVCEVCNKKFSCRSKLVIHSRMHTGSRPFKCTECGLSVATSSNLNRHLATHLAIKPHLCDRCGRTFARNHALKNHACNAQDGSFVAVN